jgi:hypothetical protein
LRSCLSGCHPAGICFFFCVLAFLAVIPQGSASSFAFLPFWLSSRRDLLLLLLLSRP